MSVATHIPAAPAFAHWNPLAAIAARIRAAVRASEQRYATRRTAEGLMRCDDHILADIGTTRDEIRHERAGR